MLGDSESLYDFEFVVRNSNNLIGITPLSIALATWIESHRFDYRRSCWRFLPAFSLIVS